MLVLSLGTSATLFGYSEMPLEEASGTVAPFCDSTGAHLPLLCVQNCTSAVNEIAHGFGMSHDALKDASNATLTKFYMNYREMTEEEASFYSPVLNSTMYTGKVTMMQGEVDDVWVYSRELSACEVAARYHTSEFAVDTDKVESPIDATLKLPLDDLGLNYRLNVTRAVTVSSWIYPYYTNVKQTILASKGPHMALALDGDQLTFSVYTDCTGEATDAAGAVSDGVVTEGFFSAGNEELTWKLRSMFKSEAERLDAATLAPKKNYT